MQEFKIYRFKPLRQAKTKFVEIAVNEIIKCATNAFDKGFFNYNFRLDGPIFDKKSNIDKLIETLKERGFKAQLHQITLSEPGKLEFPVLNYVTIEL